MCYVTVKLIFYFRRKRQTTVEFPELQKALVQTTAKEEKKQDKEREILKSFIQKNIKQGFQESVIKQALLKQGWPREKVEQAFKESK